MKKILDLHPVFNNSIEISYVHERDRKEDSFTCPKLVDKDKYRKWIESIAISEKMGLIMYYDPFRFISGKNPAGPNLQLETGAKNNALQSNILFQGESTCRDLELKQWVVNMDYRRLKESSGESREIFEHMVTAFNLLMHPLVFQYIDAQGAIIFKDEKENKNLSLDMLSDGFKSFFYCDRYYK